MGCLAPFSASSPGHRWLTDEKPTLESAAWEGGRGDRSAARPAAVVALTYLLCYTPQRESAPLNSSPLHAYGERQTQRRNCHAGLKPESPDSPPDAL